MPLNVLRSAPPKKTAQHSPFPILKSDIQMQNEVKQALLIKIGLVIEKGTDTFFTDSFVIHLQFHVIEDV